MPTLITVVGTLSALVASARGQLPEGVVTWLQPTGLPNQVGQPINTWKNTLGGVGATVDAAACYPGAVATCARPPTAAKAGSYMAANFTSSGRFALGDNLIVPGNYATADQEYSVFYVSSTVAGPLGQRLLSSRYNNWVLGSWYDPDVDATLIDRAYAFMQGGDDGWMSSGRAASDGRFRLYGMTVSRGNDTSGGISSGCAWRNATIIGCSYTAQGPNVLRLGGGIGSLASGGPAEFGNGLIVELITWARALTPLEVFAVAQDIAARYPDLNWG